MRYPRWNDWLAHVAATHQILTTPRITKPSTETPEANNRFGPILVQEDPNNRYHGPFRLTSPQPDGGTYEAHFVDRRALIEHLHDGIITQESWDAALYGSCRHAVYTGDFSFVDHARQAAQRPCPDRLTAMHRAFARRARKQSRRLPVDLQRATALRLERTRLPIAASWERRLAIVRALDSSRRLRELVSGRVRPSSRTRL
jgi:hypothetical protein